MAHDVFISYASKDIKTVEAIVNYFEGKKIRCWYADRDIPAGEDWASSIISALGTARLFVLVFTDFSNESRQVLREVNTAVNNGIPIVPFKMTSNSPTGGMMYYLSTVHWLDALNEELEQAIENLYLTVDALLNSKSVPQFTSNTKNEIEKKKKVSRKKIAIIAAAAAALIAVSAGLYINKLSSKIDTKTESSMISGYDRGEVNLYDPLGMKKVIDDNLFEDGKIVPEDSEFSFTLQDITTGDTENMKYYSFEVEEGLEFPDDITLYSVFVSVDTDTNNVIEGGYSTEASFEACLNMIDYFDEYFGITDAYKQGIDGEYKRIEGYSVEEFKNLFKNGELSSDYNYLIYSAGGNIISFNPGSRYTRNAVIMFGDE